jgi:hypothetical protein
VIAWIRIDGGSIFEGTPEQFDDCFGGVFFIGPDDAIRRRPDESAKSIVLDFCMQTFKCPSEQVEFFDEVPDEFKKEHGP